MNSCPTPVKAVLFDIGGVVVDLNDMPGMLEMASIGERDAFHERWLHCPAVRAFESGRCGPDDFAAGVVSDLGLSVTPGRFLEIFAQWPKAVFEGIKDLIRETREQVIVGCLSNTNELHWPTFADELCADDLFEYRFLSFELSLLKPDAGIFECAATTLHLPPETILFLDDSPLNVAAAKRAGFRAERVCGPAQARAAIERENILPTEPVKGPDAHIDPAGQTVR